MAILVNMGQRGFILKEGFLAPGKELIVDSETGKQLASIYKSELKLICPEDTVKEVKVVPSEDKCEGPKIEPKDEKPVKRGRPKKVEDK